MPSLWLKRMILREVSFLSPGGLLEFEGTREFWKSKGEQKSFWYLKGGGGDRRILKILLKKKLKSQNINLY